MMDALRELAYDSLCRSPNRFGRGLSKADSRDGGWWLCEDKGMLQTRGSCAIYSVGTGYNPSFDLELARAWPSCRVIMLDPTPTVAMTLTANESLWSSLSSGELCVTSAPLRLAEVSCAIVISRPRRQPFQPTAQTRRAMANHANDSPVRLRSFKAALDAQRNLVHVPWGLAHVDNTDAWMRNHWTLPARVRGLTMLTLESIMRRLGRPPSVLKLDIEGGEQEILARNASMLTSSPAKQLLLELHGSMEFWPLLEAAAAAGYAVWRAEENADRRVASKGGKNVVVSLLKSGC